MKKMILCIFVIASLASCKTSLGGLLKGWSATPTTDPQTGCVALMVKKCPASSVAPYNYSGEETENVLAVSNKINRK